MISLADSFSYLPTSSMALMFSAVSPKEFPPFEVKRGTVSKKKIKVYVYINSTS